MLGYFLSIQNKYQMPNYQKTDAYQKVGMQTTIEPPMDFTDLYDQWLDKGEFTGESKWDILLYV